MKTILKTDTTIKEICDGFVYSEFEWGSDDLMK